MSLDDQHGAGLGRAELLKLALAASFTATAVGFTESEVEADNKTNIPLTLTYQVKGYQATATAPTTAVQFKRVRITTDPTQLIGATTVFAVGAAESDSAGKPCECGYPHQGSWDANLPLYVGVWFA
jgi:hypothetical protein